MPCSSSTTTIISKCTIYPATTTTTTTTTSSRNKQLVSLKLSVSDLPMLSCHYIQKGLLFAAPPPDVSFDSIVESVKLSLSSTLSLFPPLAGRLSTSLDGHVHIICNDSGVDFLVARAHHLSISTILSPHHHLPDSFKDLFPYDKTLISYAGHSNPLAAVQVTELAGGLFIGCTVNHAVTDGTSFWHFFNTFAAICKSPAMKKITKLPHFDRHTVFDSPAVLKLPAAGPTVTFSGDQPLRERIFHFSREAIQTLKFRANNPTNNMNLVEIMSKQINDGSNRTKIHNGKSETEISSFQSLCAQVWRCVTRGRNLVETKTTTFRMAVNCRHRVEPRLDPYYFGNAIQSIPTTTTAGELLSNDLSFGALLLHKNVVAHDNETVRRGVEDWEMRPRLFPLGNFDGAMITMGSSPRFPMYDNDFGWGRPLAVRSGRANKFDGKISAFPGRQGNGTVDLELVLAPSTLFAIENDPDFMHYVSI